MCGRTYVERTACKSWVSPATVWVLGLNSNHQGMASGIFTYWPVSSVWLLSFAVPCNFWATIRMAMELRVRIQLGVYSQGSTAEGSRYRLALGPEDARSQIKKKIRDISEDVYRD